MFPQAHGDVYGHYLTALTGYYKLLTNPFFDWVPEAETVSVLGQTVEVDYKDERKFASAARALARTGSDILDFTARNQLAVAPVGERGPGAAPDRFQPHRPPQALHPFAIHQDPMVAL